MNNLNAKDIFNLVFNRSLFDFESYGVIFDRQIFSTDTQYYSLIINYHPQVIEDIKRVRNQIGIKLIPYPKDRNLDQLLKLVYEDIDKEYRLQIEKEVSKMQKKYSLSELWKLSLIVKILTDVLPIPPDEGKAVFHEPMMENRKVEMFAAIDYKKRITYPSIHILEKFDSKNEFYEWIGNNWDKISLQMNKLPKRKLQFTKMNLRSFYLGIWSYHLHEQKNMKWSEVIKLINSIEDQYPDFFGKNGQNTPSEIELSKLSSQTKDYLNKFYPLDFSE